MTETGWPVGGDGRLERLEVFLELGRQTVHAGRLTFEGRGRGQSAFTYATDYLARPGRFALAPVALPLGRRAIVSQPHALPLPFYDAAPDGWGRGVLQRTFPNQAFGMAEFLAAAIGQLTDFMDLHDLNTEDRRTVAALMPFAFSQAGL